MRTILISFALLVVSMVCKAQDINSIFDNFKHRDNVVFVDVPKELISLGLKSSGNKDSEKWAKKIDHLRILTLEDANRSTKRDFKKMIEALSWKDYNDIVKVNDNGEKVRIMTQGTDELIKRLIICSFDKEDCVLVVIDGNILPKDIDGIVNDTTIGK